MFEPQCNYLQLSRDYKVRNRTQTVSYYRCTIGAHNLVQCGARHLTNRAKGLHHRVHHGMYVSSKHNAVFDNILISPMRNPKY